MNGVSFRLRRAFSDLRVEGAGPLRETAAVGLGVFIGCLPVYGLHLLICWMAGSMLRLNRLKMYVAANISNPLVAPWLIFAEVQAGAHLRRGSFHALTPETFRTTDAAVFGIDFVVGSLFVGGVLAALAAVVTYATLSGSAADPGFTEAVRRAADRYVGTSIPAWEFGRTKLLRDPVYRAILCRGITGSGGTLLDIGCGQGLTLALLAEARRMFDAGALSFDPPPRFDQLIGIETRPRVARLARRALGDDAEVVEADARGIPLRPSRVILLFDVLQMMHAEQQEALLAAARSALEPDGVMLVREADASAGWRFVTVKLGNRLKALTFGAWRQPFHFRTEAEWRECFARHGLRADVRDESEGLPFANLLFRLTPDT